jgi:cyclic dehypoxanthinyl futalosine synthase
MKKELLIEKVLNKQRLSIEEGTALYDLDLLTIGKLAEKSKEKFHTEPIVTFVIDRNITYTNICTCRCNFCAFYVKPGSENGYTLNINQIIEKVGELVDIGGTQIMLQGGLNPNIRLDFYENLLKEIKQNFNVHIHSLSVAEIVSLAKKEKMSPLEILTRLHKAGLDSMPGASEILVDRVRKIISPAKVMTEQWLEVMRSAHSIGMHTTATMTFGMVETLQERIIHLSRIRELQDETGGFKAFIPWTFSPHNTKLSHLKMAGGIDYLKTLAISRIMLDNIPHVHAGWVTEGPKLAQMGLFFGANDLGGILMEEVVVRATGIVNKTSAKEIVDLIKSAGKIPAQRNSKYEIIRYF